MEIYELTEITEDVIQAIQRLIPQLTHHSHPPSIKALKRMVKSDSVIVFLARAPGSEGEILGSAALGIFETPTGIHGWIEDVVVDVDARRKGVGRALTQACLDKARDLGLLEVNLTSRPSRVAANQLYQAMGFVRRETNVYRYALD